MKLQELTEQLAEFLAVPDKEGLLVTEVKKKSEAEKAGFKAGDVITKIGKESVDNIEDFSEAARDYKEDEEATFEVIRKGKPLSLKMKMPDEDDYSSNDCCTPNGMCEQKMSFGHELPGLQFHLNNLKTKMFEMKDRLHDQLHNLQYKLKMKLSEL